MLLPSELPSSAGKCRFKEWVGSPFCNFFKFSRNQRHLTFAISSSFLHLSRTLIRRVSIFSISTPFVRSCSRSISQDDVQRRYPDPGHARKFIAAFPSVNPSHHPSNCAWSRRPSARPLSMSGVPQLVFLSSVIMDYKALRDATCRSYRFAVHGQLGRRIFGHYFWRFNNTWLTIMSSSHL